MHMMNLMHSWALTTCRSMSIYEEENDRYSATLYDKDGNPQMPYLNDKNLHKLVEQILEDGEKDDGRD